MCERKQLRYHQALGCLLLWFLFRFTWVEPCHFNTYQTHVALTAHLDIIVWRKTNLMHNLFWVYFVTLYMFRAYLGPSPGVTTLCIQQLVLFILFRWLLSSLDWNNLKWTTAFPFPPIWPYFYYAIFYQRKVSIERDYSVMAGLTARAL